MNTDFRIKVAFFQHHKTRKLIYKLGHEGAFCLMSLWAYTAQNKPKGILIDLDKLDITLSAGWENDVDKFVDTLVELKFLDVHNGVYSIHNWQNHNAYAYFAEERSEKARNAAEYRWNKKKGKDIEKSI